MAEEVELFAGMKKIGFLHSGSKDTFVRHVEEFKDSLEEEGWDIGKDGEVDLIEPLYSNDITATIRTNARTLVGLDGSTTVADIIVAAGGPASAKAAMQARIDAQKPNLPIVFTSVVDPGNSNVLNIGNLDSPTTYITGMAGLTSELDIDRWRLLREILVVPAGSTKKIGVLRRSGRANEGHWYALLETAITDAGFVPKPQEVADTAVDHTDQIKGAFNFFRTEGVLGVIVTADPLFNNKRKLIVRLAANKWVNPLPAIYQWREFVVAGGLMSYGPTMKEAYRHAAKYVARLLEGKDVPDLPVAYPSEFELVINRKVAKKLTQLGLIKIPRSMTSRAIRLGQD